MKPPLKGYPSDDFQTPPEALKLLIPYLKREWLIWECAQGEGNLTEALIKEGYNVIGSDILTGQNFLTDLPDMFDCIVTNPPYSFKQQFLERAYSLKKPFAFLLPLTTLETAKRLYLFAKYGIEIIFLNNRINFITPNKKQSKSWFASAWFTNGLKIGKQLVFPTIRDIPVQTTLTGNQSEIIKIGF